MPSGCGCKEIFRFPHITCPYSAAASLLFVHFFKCFSFLFQYIFVIYLIIFSHSINKHTGDYGHCTEAVCRAAHVLYAKKHIQTYASYPAMDISCMTSRSVV